MIFEDLPTTPTAEELVDTAFSRAARAGGSKGGTAAQLSMLQTASNVLSDNLANVVTKWPDFDSIDPFYYELADAIVGAAEARGTGDAPSGVDELRKSLSEIQWASRKTKELGREYQRRASRTDPDTARKLRKQAFARLADVVEEVGDDLVRVGAARNALRDLPDIRPDEPTIVVAGYPNVGKSTFVNAVTNARNEIAAYPFTTRGVYVGHLERDHIRYQIVDTPGLLDRPPAERNEIENQAASAITHLADCILFFVDPSGDCGYPRSSQLELRDSIRDEFTGVPVLTIGTKADRSTDVDADYHVSVQADENVDVVLQAAVDAIGYEPPLPIDDRS